jgi:hypothetical protein
MATVEISTDDVGIRRIMDETGLGVAKILRLALDGHIRTFVPEGEPRRFSLSDAMRLAEQGRKLRGN